MVAAPVFAQETQVAITDKISVKFPAQPVKQEMGPSTIYTVKLADSTANFVVAMTDLNKANGLTADVLAQAMEDPSFWDQVEQGFLMSAGQDVKLVSKEMKVVGGKDVLQIVAERGGDKPSVLTVWIMVDGVNTINLVHTNRGNKANAELRDKYFSSLAIAK